MQELVEQPCYKRSKPSVKRDVSEFELVTVENNRKLWFTLTACIVHNNTLILK